MVSVDENSSLVASSLKEATGSRENMALFPKGTGTNYDNSSKLRRLNLEKYPGVKGCSASLLEDMKLVPRLFPQRPSDVRKLQHHVAFFVVNLYHVFLQDQTRWLSFSRNKMKYTGKDSKYKHTFKLSHEYSVNKVTKFLLDSQYIDHSPFIHYPDDPSKSRQSRIRATEKLIDLIRRHEQESLPPEDGDDQADPDDDRNDYEGEETIVVKGLKPPPRYVWKMENGVKKKKKIQPKRKVCQTPDTPQVRKMRENLSKINALMDRTEITLDVTEEELQRLNENLRRDGNAVIDFTRKRLHRVFIDRRLDRGGRFYGAWYQGIPKEYREHILINGSPVCEPDFSGYHPRMLYAMQGFPLISDPYQLDGYPDTDEMRNFLKPLLLMIVNAKDEQGAIRGMWQKLRKEANKAERWGRKIVPLGVEISTDAQYREVMSKLMFLHQPIEKFFYTGMGSYLQHLDSQIAEAIMLHLADNYDTAVLPVHDSFIVDFRFEGFLNEYMNQVVEQALKQQFPVKRNMGGMRKKWGLAERLSDEMVEQFKDTFLEALKDLPKNEGWLRAWEEKEAKPALEKLKAFMKDQGIK